MVIVKKIEDKDKQVMVCLFHFHLKIIERNFGHLVLNSAYKVKEHLHWLEIDLFFGLLYDVLSNILYIVFMIIIIVITIIVILKNTKTLNDEY